MRHTKIANALFKKNRAKIVKEIDDNSLVLIHSADSFPRNGDQLFDYRQASNFLYLTGIHQEKSVLCLCPNHPEEKNREILFVLKSNKYLETWEGYKLTKEEATDISGIENVQYIDDYENVLESLLQYNESVYLSYNYKKDNGLNTVNKRVLDEFKNKYPFILLKDLNPIIEKHRTVKEKEEINTIEKACEITKSAFEDVLSGIKPGMYEYEIEAILTHRFIKSGASGHAYQPIVASGVNACVLHYNENDKQIKAGGLVLMDFGAEYAGYAADCSRTIPVTGKFSKRQRACYEAVLRVFKKSKALMVPGNSINIVNKKTNEWMEGEMIKLGLFTKEETRRAKEKGEELYKQYFMHGTSHFMGLDVHDCGGRDVVFEKGMVVTCEPGLYIKEEGIGIRIENDIMIEDKPIDLMQNIPIEPDDIEDAIKKNR